MNKPSNEIRLASLGLTPNLWKSGQCRHRATQMHQDSTSKCHYALFHVSSDNTCSSSAFCSSKMLKLDATWKKCHCIPSAVLLEQSLEQFCKASANMSPLSCGLDIGGWVMTANGPNEHKPCDLPRLLISIFCITNTLTIHTKYIYIPHWNKKNPKIKIPNNNSPHG